MMMIFAVATFALALMFVGAVLFCSGCFEQPRSRSRVFKEEEAFLYDLSELENLEFEMKKEGRKMRSCVFKRDEATLYDVDELKSMENEIREALSVINSNFC